MPRCSEHGIYAEWLKVCPSCEVAARQAELAAVREAGFREGLKAAASLLTKEADRQHEHGAKFSQTSIYRHGAFWVATALVLAADRILALPYPTQHTKKDAR